MKKPMILLLVLTMTSTLFAQAPDVSAKAKEEMKKLAYFAGDWKGEAIHKGPKGAVTVMQQEHIEWRLQGLVMTIEGTGRQKNETSGVEEITFQAFAVVNFDYVEQQFKFKSFVKEGYS